MPLSRQGRASGPAAPSQVPKLPVEVDWSHPLSAGLVACYVPGGSRGLVDLTGIGPVLRLGTGAKFGATSMGAGLINTAASAGASSANFPDPWKLQTAGTLFVAADIYGAPTVSNGAYWGNNYNSADTTPFVGYLLYQDFSAKKLTLSWNRGGTFGDILATSVTVPTSGRHSLAGTFVVGVSGPAVVYQDGVQVGSGSFGGASPPNYTTTTTAILGGDLANPTRVTNAGIVVALTYNRALSASEMALLDADPFCMLRPISVRAAGNATGLSGLSGVLVASLANAILTAKGSVGIASALSRSLANGALAAAARGAIGAKLARSLSDGSVSGSASSSTSGGLNGAFSATPASASGGTKISGGASRTLSSSAVSGTASSTISARVARALDTVLASASGTSSLNSILAEALSDALLSGKAGSTISGRLAEGLNPTVLSGIATVIAGADATLFENLDPMVLTAAGTVSLAASLFETVGIPLSGRGTSSLRGSLSQGIPVNLSGLGAVSVTARLSESLQSSILTAVATLVSFGSRTASLSQALQDAHLLASGTVLSSARMISAASITSLSGRAASRLAAELMEALDPATLIALASIGGAIRLYRPHAGRLLIVPPDHRTLIVPADNRLLSATDI